MKAALCKTLDGADAIVIEEIAPPTPEPDEVAVEVHYAALNFLDTLIVRGKYQYKPNLPFSPAAECAGIVRAVGAEVTDLAVGDAVCGYLGWGCAREVVVAPRERWLKVPAGVGLDAAATIPVAYGTAHHGLKDRARVKPGETVAVLGASGGAGLAAVEVAKALGAGVIAVASTDEKLAVCRQHGADEVINYAKEDLRLRLKAITGRGVDVVFDCVGGSHTEPAIRALAWEGRLLVVGFAAGDIPKLPTNLILLKNCSVVGVFWGEMTSRTPELYAAGMDEVMSWLAHGQIKPHIHEIYPLHRIGEAINSLSNRSVQGKVVVKIRD